MLFTVFILISISIAIYTITSLAIIYHLKKYGIEGDITPKMFWLFIGVSIVFVTGLIFLFLSTPWEEIITNLK